MNRLWTITKKEFFHIWRDTRTLALALLLPAMLLVLLGYGISGESNDIPMAVADYSKSDASREFITRFTASRDFKLTYDASSEDELLSLIDQDLADVGILIPEDFGRQITTGGSATIQVYINGSTDPSDVQTIQLKLNSISQMATQEIFIRALERAGGSSNLLLPIDTRVQTLYNPNGDRNRFTIPGLIPIILQVQTLILAALAIVKEREQGTMEQLIVTPLRSWELMLGKILPYLLLSIVNLVALLLLSQWMFGVGVAGNLWDLIILSLVFIIGSLGMGVLISNIAQSQMQAMYIAIFVVLIPAIILTGLILPRDNMPAFTYAYSELLPVTQYLEITRGIMVRGIGVDQLWWPSIFPLLLFSVLYFALSVLVFRKRL